MIDIARQLRAIHREVGTRQGGNGEVVGVLLRRSYDAAAEDVWDAVTDPDRLARWFLPVSGDLRVGGAFQLEGNAGGEVLVCEPPRHLSVTWGAPTSVVELRLTPDGDATVVELEHTVPVEMAGSVAGALYVGPGWDEALLALALFVTGEVGDPAAVAGTPEGRQFSRASVDAWVSAVEVAGTASAEEIAGATAAALAQFAPDAAAPSSR